MTQYTVARATVNLDAQQARFLAPKIAQYGTGRPPGDIEQYTASGVLNRILSYYAAIIAGSDMPQLSSDELEILIQTTPHGLPSVGMLKAWPVIIEAEGAPSELVQKLEAMSLIQRMAVAEAMNEYIVRVLHRRKR